LKLVVREPVVEVVICAVEESALLEAVTREGQVKAQQIKYLSICCNDL
jgi:hypothetical protein